MKYWNLKSQLINTVTTVHSCFDQYCDLHKADSIFHCSYYIGCCWEIFNLLSSSFLSMPWLLRTPLLLCFIINQAWWSLVSWPGDVPWLLPASLLLWLESQSNLLWYLKQATHQPRSVCPSQVHIPWWVGDTLRKTLVGFFCSYSLIPEHCIIEELSKKKVVTVHSGGFSEG